MNVSPISGPRTLISRSAGVLTLPGHDKPTLRTFIPGIPTGGLCVPTVDYLNMLTGGELPPDEVRSAADELRMEYHRAGVPPVHMQVIITEELGCIDTLSTDFIVANIEGLGVPHCDTLAEHIGVILDEMADDTLGDDGKGGDMAAFESLTRLHRCAGSPRGKAPGHWRHLRGKELSDAVVKKGRKGVWRTADGEWRASHDVALDYAQWLFPAFQLWTIRLLADDPRVTAAFHRIFGFGFTISEPAAPAPEPHLRLVHSDQGEAE
ncbi:hypothetical protein E6C67_26660 [Azospirillum sp. TSA2s]|uniref:hypothetical protein n=1 Tax=Azospirillum sp. TSA2s TaxID=709810 RepID=UPI0010AA93B8|nr:hypothetical protein [Azospirillum sp. TSA2s]QCG97357.1 hypothetical protein E6C67_26660 [Azospirillum sp. TSA2s]